MLGFDRRAARAAWTVALIAGLLFATYSIRRTAFVFVLAIFFSYMVSPVIEWVEKRFVRRFKSPATLHLTATVLVFVVLIAVIVGLAVLAGPPIAAQASKLAEQLPALTQDSSFIDRLPMPEWLDPYRARVAGFLREHLASGTAAAVPFARQVGGAVLSVASNLIFVVLIPILAFLFIKDASAMHKRYREWAEGRRDPSMWRGFANDLDTLLGSYIRALLLLALATLVIYAIFLSVIGVPYGLLLATVAGVLEFIPVVGPVAAGVTIVLVAGLSGYSHLLLLIGFLVVYRLFQDYVLNPYLMSDGVSLPPLMVLFGLLAGEELGGIVGIFLSVPVLATARIAVLRIAQALNKRERSVDGQQVAAVADDRHAALVPVSTARQLPATPLPATPAD